MIVQVLKGDDITIYGDGAQTKSFQYVYDLIKRMIKLVSSKLKFTGPANIGNHIEFTVLELAHKVIKLINRKLKITFSPLPQNDSIQRQPSIHLTKKELSWKTTIQLEDRLKKTIKYFGSVI